MSDRLTSSVVIVPQAFPAVAQIAAATPHDPPFISFWPSGEVPELHARVDAADTVLVVDIARDEQLDAILERAVRDGKNVVRSRAETLDDVLRRTVRERKAAFHLDVFISYAREDGGFAASVANDLRDSGKSVWMDRHNIRPSEQWVQAVHSGIDAADHVIAVVSPSFLSSAACREELEYAAANGKHLVPLLHHDVGEQSLPEPIRLLNWIDFTAGERVKAMAALVEALETDFEHVQSHTRLLRQAKEWDATSRDRARLLRGRALREAETWLAGAGEKRPAVRAVQRDFIRAAVMRRRLWRAFWGSIGTLLAAMALAIPLLTIWSAASDLGYYDGRAGVVSGVLAIAALVWQSVHWFRRRFARVEPKRWNARVPGVLACTCCALAICPGWGAPREDAMATAIARRDYPMLSRMLARDNGRIPHDASDQLSREVDQWTPDADALLEFLIRRGYDPARLSTDNSADTRRSLGEEVSLRVARLIAPRLTKEQRSEALKWAAFAGRPGVAALYLARGREGAVDAFDEALDCTGGSTTFSDRPAITMNGCRMTARMLVDVVPLEERTFGDDYTPLMCAAGAGDLEMMQRLIARGANVNAMSRNRETPLTLAALYRKSLEATRFLVEHGANIEHTDEEGNTIPVQARAYVGRVDSPEMPKIAAYLESLRSHSTNNHS